MEIREISRESLPQVQRLWTERFTSDEEYLKTAFGTILPRCRTFCIFEQDAVRSTASFMPFTFISKGIRSLGWYLFGVATEKASEGRRYASDLISSAIGQLKTEGADFIFERPANQSLNRFYIKLGFTISLSRIPYRFPFESSHAETTANLARQILSLIAAKFPKRFEWSDEEILKGLVQLGEISANNASLRACNHLLETYIAVNSLRRQSQEYFQGTFFCFPME